jgi:hypothetical protein
MSDTLFFVLGIVFGASAGFLCLFHPYKVQAAMVRIRNKHRFFGLWIWRGMVESPYYILILRTVGVGAWLISVASLIGLTGRLFRG